MEEEKKEEKQTEEESEETSPETQEEEEESEDSSAEEEGDVEEEDDDSDDSPEVDYKKELEEKKKGEGRSELEKAERSLYFNAERLKELGGDPDKVLTPEKKKEEKSDETSIIDQRFAERDARQLAGSDDEYELIMYYVRENDLSIEEAHLLANKGSIKRSITEAKRSSVTPSTPSTGGRKVTPKVTSKHPNEALLLRRGYKFNSKTGTYQGKFYEEYYDKQDKQWKSRRM